MAFFKKKPPGEGDQGGNGPPEPDFQPQPEQARKWFEHARSMADRYNYDSALVYYANGIKLDPGAMSAHEALLEAAIQYHTRGGKPASGKEIRGIDGPTSAEKFAAAEFAWMKSVANSALALKALEAAVKAQQLEWGHWIAPRILSLLRQAKRKTKGPLLQARDLFAKVSAWDAAIAAGSDALALDPSDNDLANELNDLTAQRAMDQGGYERAVEQGSGGFREFVRDIEKQRELEEKESLSGGQTVEERNLARAREEYQANPTSPDVINKYAQLLRRQGTPSAEQEACEILMKAYDELGEYRFRMAAGDIKIDQGQRAVDRLAAEVQATPDNGQLKAQMQQSRQALLALKATEYRERVEKYPTDRRRHFDLGQVEFELRRFEEAMKPFQSAKEEPKLRVRAGQMLGRCFAAEGWHREAVQEFKDAIEAIDATQKDLELAIRYDLMNSLIAQARDEQSVDLAREALDICSTIARKDIGFQDIRSKRKEIDALIKELDGGS